MQSLESIPYWLAQEWGISLEAAQAILSLVVVLMVMLPVLVVARGSRAVTIEIVMLVIVESFLVGIGWLPFWLLIATVCAMSIAVAFLGRNAILGG